MILRGMDTKYLAHQKSNWKFYWLPVIPENFSWFYDTTVGYIMVNFDNTFMNDGTNKYILGNAIASKIA